MRRRLAAALLLLAAMLAPAQEPAPARRVLLYMVALPGSQIGDEDLLVLYESLVARLLAEAPSIVPVEAPAVGRAPASPAERSREAWREGADAWLWIGVGEGARTLRVQSLDAAAGGEVRDEAIEAAPGSGPQAAWDGVVAAAGPRFAALPATRQAAAQPAQVLTAEVRIRAVAGTRISGLVDGEIVVGSEGEATVSLVAPGAYRIVATHPEYLPVTRSFYLKEQPLLIECAQKRVGRWAFEVALTRLSYPSFEAQWFAVPDRLFVAVGVTSFAAGVPLWADEDNTRVPLTQVGVSVNLYLGRPQAALRPYAAAEAFARLLGDTGEGWPGVELDPVSKAGFGLALGLELAKHPLVRPYVEANPQAYLLTDGEQIELYYDTLDLYREDVPEYVTHRTGPGRSPELRGRRAHQAVSPTPGAAARRLRLLAALPYVAAALIVCLKMPYLFSARAAPGLGHDRTPAPRLRLPGALCRAALHRLRPVMVPGAAGLCAVPALLLLCRGSARPRSRSLPAAGGFLQPDDPSGRAFLLLRLAELCAPLSRRGAAPAALPARAMS